MFPKDQSVEEVLAQPAEAVLAFVRQHESAIDGSLPWQELAEAALNKATAVPDGLTWATAAVLLGDRLAERCDERRDRAHFAKAVMELRALMLNAHGPESGHPVLDPMILEAWFFRGLELRYEKAARMLGREDELPTEEFLALNRLKDRVRILRSVARQEMFRRGLELEQWYGLVE